MIYQDNYIPAFDFIFHMINPSGAENWIYQKNQVNTMAVDDLAPCIARSSASMVLTMQEKLVLIFYGEGFPLTVKSLI